MERIDTLKDLTFRDGVIVKATLSDPPRELDKAELDTLNHELGKTTINFTGFLTCE